MIAATVILAALTLLVSSDDPQANWWSARISDGAGI